MTDQNELHKELKDGVVNYNKEQVVEASQKVVVEKYDALEAVMEGLAAGMEEVGRLFDTEEYFVPEVLMCAEALYAGLDILKPHIDKKEGDVKGTLVIGSVEGDVHDIGKNIVKMMFDIAGWDVYDLGRDVPLENFVNEQLRTNSDIVAMSAMMTTTMQSMKRAVEMIKEKNPNVAIMLGGAPVTRETADLFGADGYAESSGNAVSEAIKMVARLREQHGQNK